MKLTKTITATAIQLQHDIRAALDDGMLRGKAGEWLVREDGEPPYVVRDLAEAGFQIAPQDGEAEANLRELAAKYRA